MNYDIIAWLEFNYNWHNFDWSLSHLRRQLWTNNKEKLCILFLRPIHNITSFLAFISKLANRAIFQITFKICIASGQVYCHTQNMRGYRQNPLMILKYVLVDPRSAAAARLTEKLRPTTRPVAVIKHFPYRCMRIFDVVKSLKPGQECG